MSSILSDLHSLKNAAAAEIIARVSDLAEQHQGLASHVRQAITGGTNGPKPVFPTADSDKRTVEVALLGLLVEEISYAPSALQRGSQIEHVELACKRVNISYDEVIRCSRRAPELVKLFDGK
jgi:hypothetical protein